MKKAVFVFPLFIALITLSGCCHTKGERASEAEKTACGCPEGCGCASKTADTCTCPVHNA